MVIWELALALYPANAFCPPGSAHVRPAAISHVSKLIPSLVHCGGFHWHERTFKTSALLLVTEVTYTVTYHSNNMTFIWYGLAVGLLGRVLLIHIESENMMTRGVPCISALSGSSKLKVGQTICVFWCTVWLLVWPGCLVEVAVSPATRLSHSTLDINKFRGRYFKFQNWEILNISYAQCRYLIVADHDKAMRRLTFHACGLLMLHMDEWSLHDISSSISRCTYCAEIDEMLSAAAGPVLLSSCYHWCQQPQHQQHP